MKRTQIVVSDYKWNVIWLDALKKVRDERQARCTEDGKEPKFPAMWIEGLLRNVRKALEEADA